MRLLCVMVLCLLVGVSHAQTEDDQDFTLTVTSTDGDVTLRYSCDLGFVVHDSKGELSIDEIRIGKSGYSPHYPCMIGVISDNKTVTVVATRGEYTTIADFTLANFLTSHEACEIFHCQ